MVKKLTIWSYLEPFLYSQESLHLADISKKLKKQHTTARKHLNNFEKQGILIKSIKGRLTLYRINLSAPLLVEYLVLAEKEKLLNACRKDLLLNELISFLHQHLQEDNKALIFGSAATDSKKANDVDLLITGKINFKDRIKQFEKKFNKKIHLINTKNLKTITQSLRMEISKKHLIIQGSEEIAAWLL
ncbi:MAG: nucleotidyltransferase domain-containing protein [Nanoarchaeota archaeon]|nr:nucleotidyltransferase domain-containing protein [Nanoarchaeota archaeon]